MEMEELEASELGTQEYWESRYKMEIKSFESHGDPGEVWFGEDIVDRVITWLKSNKTTQTNDKIIDIGCGNGMFLIELSTEGYNNLYGVDYSEGAIKLAKAVAQKQNVHIHYSTCNILVDGLNDIYDIIHDKGTYDAITLSENVKENRTLYLQNVSKSLKENGFFIITSCNWTKCELDEQFKDYFDCFHVIPTPQFKFDGKVGNVVTSLIYKRKGCE